jgi:hypothetical protein
MKKSFELGTDEAVCHTKELFRQTLQESGMIWVVIRFLQKVQAQDKWFHYEIAKDKNGSPIGVVWTTRVMREAFIRFGDKLFLDFMKQEMNHLHWAYHGPCVLTEELEVQVVCKGLFIEEALPTYAFALNFILDKEPRCSRDSIRIVFGDCFLSNELFTLVALRYALCIWDHFHLLKKVWPEKFGPVLYAKLEHRLHGMLNAESPEAFDDAFQQV